MITDMNMPRMDGLALIRTIRRDFGDIYVILDLIKIYFDFRNDFCVSVEFGSYAARNMFP